MSGISRDDTLTPGQGPAGFGWSQRSVDGAVVVHLAGDLDLSTAVELRRRLGEVGDSDADVIVLDLSDVHFIDARSIDLIVAAWDAAGVRGRRLYVDGLHGIPAYLFRLVGLEPMVTRPRSEQRT